MAIKRHGELEYCEFQMLEIWGFAISSFEKYRLVSVCPFLMFPGRKGDGGVGRPLVLCHSTRDLEFCRL